MIKGYMRRGMYDEAILKYAYSEYRKSVVLTDSNKRRDRFNVLKRQAFFKAARERGFTCEAIGEACEKDHSTVVYGLKKHDANANDKYLSLGESYLHWLKIGREIVKKAKSEINLSVSDDVAVEVDDLVEENENLKIEVMNLKNKIYDKSREIINISAEVKRLKEQIDIQSKAMNMDFKHIFTPSDYADAIGIPKNNVRRAIKTYNIPYFKASKYGNNGMFILDKSIENHNFETNIESFKQFK